MLQTNGDNERLPSGWIASVLVLAAALRIVGVGYGQPFWLVNDELPLVGGALRMMELRNVVPSMNPGPMSILYYPPGLPWLYLVVWSPVLAVQYVLAGFPSLETFADMLFGNLGPVWTTARLISAAFSVATVWVVMRLAAEVLRNRWAGLIAGLLIATSFHHGMLGHFARVWPATIFFFWWGLWACWRIYERGDRRDYVWAALAAGLGFSVNYVGVLVSLGVALAHVLRHRGIALDRRLFLHASIVALFIAVIVPASWHNFLRLMGFSGILDAVPGAGDIGGSVQTGSLVLFYLKTFVKADAPLVLAGFIGVLVLAKRAPVLLGIFAIVFAPYVILVLTGYANDDRYVLPLTPIFAIAGGAVVHMQWPALRRIGLACLAVIVIVQGALLAKLELLMLRSDTREVARSWINDNVSAGQGVVAAIRPVAVEPTIGAIRLEQEFAPGTLSYLKRRRLAGAEVLAGGGGRVQDAIDIKQVGPDALRSLGPERLLERLLAEGYRWYAVDDVSGPISDGRFEDLLLRRARLVTSIAGGPPGTFGPIFNLTDQFGRGVSFDVFRLNRLGPAVKVYHFE